MDLGFDGYRQVALLENLSLLGNQRGIVDELEARLVLKCITQAAPAAVPVDTPAAFSFSYDSVSIPAQRREAVEPPAIGAEQTPVALNFASRWDSLAASYTIISPTVIAILICILWPVVAVRKYDANVQVSVQTGISVASFLITASEHPFLGLPRGI